MGGRLVDGLVFVAICAAMVLVGFVLMGGGS
jgi:hypothetical protein